MKIFSIGATGYLGGGAARALVAAGHEVLASARTDDAAARLNALGYTAVRCDVSDPRTLIEPVRASEGVIYAVQLNGPDAAEIDAAALEALVDALAGTSKALLYTSGVWYYGPTGDRVADETTPANPPPATVARPRLEKIVLDGAARGVRAVVIRPGDVFGEASGLPSMFVQSARESGAARTIGDGSNRWPVIHVDDLARLYVQALEKAEAGDVFNATDDTA
ncbi:MAG: NAD-dependent epimerase/dehydratase family protein, partial [Candidatus Eremiobacteraeota bacterium]|nr:NAD-dependent epimerase/dehydratase family protein [Candidatus Eremiobacteraeota bacterium]